MAGEPETNEGELFAGVRFVLFGFDSVSEAQYRSELVRRGGVDAGRYDLTCTHVIVSGRVHDDPVCVAARNDGKVLVTELWIEDSVDFSELANPDRILYKPVKNLNGISGSQSFVICLTGYQRRERDDIMKMVDLMGAQFSKPLIASKVTHLVCYKFEGEKYELARRVNIKLVNHQWLEDCLRAWEILPEDDYKMSGWDLEIMKAEAKNSDDDAEDCSTLRQARKRVPTAERALEESKPPSPVQIESIVKQEDAANSCKAVQEQSPNPSSISFSSLRKPVPVEDCPQRSAMKGQTSKAVLPQKRKVPAFCPPSIKAASSPVHLQSPSDAPSPSPREAEKSVGQTTPVRPSSSSDESRRKTDGMENPGGPSINNPLVQPEQSELSTGEKSLNSSNANRRVLSKALVKRVVAKRKMSSEVKDSSRAELLQKANEESSEVLAVNPTEPPDSLTKSMEVKDPEVNAVSANEATQATGSQNKRKKAIRASEDAEKENKSTENAQATRKREKVGEKSDPAIISEPSWFILSGHRLQRREFQKIIKRLKGRVCRDSHSWSYQATHFIVPEPLRRTEKFFAAAASGRWILKSDYLAACNEAGKFLPEEAFEWGGGGLTEDGAISLEAPRKWRLLRERTGRGAFYGTRVIVYGECIAPSLDTLKRAVKAGDGEILATSPPYSRAMKAGVDFAVVSAGTPRGDPWVAEFLSREIPCVLADYLVEVVCKPGFPLDRHVLYGSLPWAEKSLAELIKRRQ